MDKISEKIDINRAQMMKKLNCDLNYDLMFRDFKFKYKNKNINCFLVFFDGMVNKDYINSDILSKATLSYSITPNNLTLSYPEFFKANIISNCMLQEKEKFSDVIKEVLFGNVAVFIDGYNKCFLCNIIQYEHRSMEKPFFENSINGPQESFNEVLNFNTALIRKNVRNKNLIIEKIQIGKRAENVCTLIYMKNLANKKLIDITKQRISEIDTDIILSTDALNNYIETNTYSPIPQILPTERPDRVASFLLQGRCAILTNNSPIAGIIPTTIIDWFHSTEDGYIKAPFNIVLKIIRLLAIFSAILLPAIYIATVTYHISVFPTNIAMSLAASRELVPLPFVVEILIMEAAFELLREAEMRVPTRIGPVVSIVGGLILGQLAVEANIICSFTMIIVGFSGIALYALPNFYISYGLRFVRYVFILLAFLNGYLALAFGIVIFMYILANSYSFEISLLPPFYEDKKRNVIAQIFTSPVWKNEVRPYTVKAQDEYSQSKISRRWLLNDKK